jgi:hypothetical protein
MVMVGVQRACSSHCFGLAVRLGRQVITAEHELICLQLALQ